MRIRFRLYVKTVAVLKIFDRNVVRTVSADLYDYFYRLKKYEKQ